MPKKTPNALILGVGHMQYDRVLLEQLLKEMTPRADIAFVQTADACESFVRNQIPTFILGELDDSTEPGCTALTRIRADEALCCIPFVVLTSRSAGQDIRFAYKTGANAVVIKPLDLKDWKSTMRAMLRFWIEHAKPWNTD